MYHFNLRFGYYGSFTSGLLCSFTGFLVVLFFFKESKKPSTDEGNGAKTSLISLKNFSDSFKVLMKKRAGEVRQVVVLLVVCMLVGSLPHTPPQCTTLTWHTIDFLYFRKKFHFADEDAMITWYTQLR